MTPEDETRIKDWVAALANGFQELQEGMRLMTDVVVKLERRVADLERDVEPKSAIIHPSALRN